MSAYLEDPEVATGMEKVNLILVSKKGSTKECANHQTITFIFHDSKVKVKVTQSCPTLCDSMSYTVHEILQARILEWVPFPFSRGSSQPRDQTQVSHIAGRFFPS